MAMRYSVVKPVAAAVAIAVLGCAACGRPSGDERAPAHGTPAPAATALRSGAADGRHVLLITLDTTRADHMGHAGKAGNPTPNIDRLAAEGTRFARAYAPTPMTLPSHSSILTGLYPPRHGVHANGEFRLPGELTTLAERLGAAGYQTAAFVSSYVLDARFGLRQGFDHYDFRADDDAGGVAGAEPERSAAAVTTAAVEWLSRRDRARPLFLWVHYFDPHFPYRPPTAFASRFEADPYLGEIAAMDAQLGRLMAGLQSAGLAADTLTVVVGDHGESLGEHHERFHSRTVYDAAIRVPFILHGGGVVPPATVEDRGVVSLVDVMPTVLDLLGLLQPADSDALEGRSLCGDPPAADRVVYAETLGTYLASGWAPLYAACGADMKYIRAPRPELYDLAADSAELTNLITAGTGDPPRARPLVGFLDAYLADKPTADEVASGVLAMDSETRAQLTALGYVDEAQQVEGAAADAPDPKDMLPLYDRYLDAKRALEENRVEDALSLARQLLDAAPRDRASWSLLGEAELKQERYGDAEDAFRRRLEIRADPLTLAYLANAVMLQERLDEAEAILARAAADYPDSGAVAFATGDLLLMQERPNEAISAYRRAARVEPVRFAAKAEARVRQLERALARR